MKKEEAEFLLKNAPKYITMVKDQYEKALLDFVSQDSELSPQNLLDVFEVSMFTCIMTTIVAEPNPEAIIVKLKKYISLLGERLIENMAKSGNIPPEFQKLSAIDVSVFSASNKAKNPVKKEDLN